MCVCLSVTKSVCVCLSVAECVYLWEWSNHRFECHKLLENRDDVMMLVMACLLPFVPGGSTENYLFPDHHHGRTGYVMLLPSPRTSQLSQMELSSTRGPVLPIFAYSALDRALVQQKMFLSLRDVAVRIVPAQFSFQKHPHIVTVLQKFVSIL